MPEGQTLRDCCKRAMGYTDDGWSRRQVAVGAATSAALATGGCSVVEADRFGTVVFACAALMLQWLLCVWV